MARGDGAARARGVGAVDVRGVEAAMVHVGWQGTGATVVRIHNSVAETVLIFSLDYFEEKVWKLLTVIPWQPPSFLKQSWRVQENWR